MRVDGKHYRTIWQDPEDPEVVKIIDQRKLPFEFLVEDLRTVEDAARAIGDMYVRGAGLIGATAGWGMYLAGLQSAGDDDFQSSLRARGDQLVATRPTAMNLSWAVQRQLDAVGDKAAAEAVPLLMETAEEIASEDAEWCRRIGKHGLELIRAAADGKAGDGPVNILTHCNAGWLAFVDHGSATAPIYAAHDAGIPVHVWVDETRPRSQGARLTAWELGKHGVPHTVIADNVGGHLMQHGEVDLVITGTDRTTFTGDVANKIGTYLKALAADDNDVPFYVALPSSTFDWDTRDGVAGIPIEERDGGELSLVDGVDSEGVLREVCVVAEGSPCANYAFDVTPARLVTALITERGICPASEEGVLGLYPEKVAAAP